MPRRQEPNVDVESRIWESQFSWGWSILTMSDITVRLLYFCMSTGFGSYLRHWDFAICSACRCRQVNDTLIKPPSNLYISDDMIPSHSLQLDYFILCMNRYVWIHIYIYTPIDMYIYIYIWCVYVCIHMYHDRSLFQTNGRDPSPWQSWRILQPSSVSASSSALEAPSSWCSSAAPRQLQWLQKVPRVMGNHHYNYDNYG